MHFWGHVALEVAGGLALFASPGFFVAFTVENYLLWRLWPR